MSGSVFLTGLVFVVLLVAAIFMTPWALIPAALMVAVFLLAGPLAGAARGTGGGSSRRHFAASQPVLVGSIGSRRGARSIGPASGIRYRAAFSM